MKFREVLHEVMESDEKLAVSDITKLAGALGIRLSKSDIQVSDSGGEDWNAYADTEFPNGEGVELNVWVDGGKSIAQVEMDGSDGIGEAPTKNVIRKAAKLKKKYAK